MKPRSGSVSINACRRHLEGMAMLRAWVGSLALLLCAGVASASAQEPSSGAAVRLESSAAGVAVEIPSGWVVQMAQVSVPDHPELLTVLHARPPSSGVSCSMMLDRTDRATLVDHAKAYRPDEPDLSLLELPAGDAIRWDLDQGEGSWATYYLVDAPEGVLMFMCGGLPRPGDAWLSSIVETIEFLPPPEE